RESGAGVEGANNCFNRSSSGRAPLDVQTSLGKAHRQSVCPEHRGEGFSNTFQEIGTKQQGSTTENQPRGPPDPDGGGGIPNNKEGHRGGGESEPRILQQFILHSKEDGRVKTGIGSKETEPASRGKKLQDGVPSINLQDNQGKGFYDVPGFEGSISAYPNQEVVQKIHALLLEWTKLPAPCSTVRFFAESSYIHENPAPSSALGTDSENQGISILGRPDNSRRIDRSMHGPHRAYKFEAYRAGILDKHDQVRADPLSENHTPWYDHRQQKDVIESSNIKDTRPTMRSSKTDKRWENVAQMLSKLYMKCTSDVGGAITGKLMLSRLPELKNKSRLKNASWKSMISGGPIGYDLLRQYDHPSIRKGIRWNYFTQTSQHSGTPMGAFPEDEYQASSNVCTVSSEPGGCTEPLNCNERMVAFEQDILSIGKEARTRCGTTGQDGRTLTAARLGT
ncbi:hypothetical protein AYI68_g7193, partial [Smittium mucronatum]